MKPLESLQPAISVEDCPLSLTYCVAEWMPVSCKHFRGVIVLKSGYVGIVCTGALEQEGDDEQHENGGSLCGDERVPT